MFRKAVETIFTPYHADFSEAIWTNACSLAHRVSRKQQSLEEMFGGLATDDSILSHVSPWYTTYDDSYQRKHKKPAVKQHFALLRQLLLVRGDFSLEDVVNLQNSVIKSAQRTYDVVILCFRAIPGISSLPVVTLFVLLACVAMGAPELTEAGMNTNLRKFVAENLAPVMYNAAEIGGTSQARKVLDLSLDLCECWNNVIPSKVGWQPSYLQAMQITYDKEVGNDELNLPDPTMEGAMLFDDQPKPQWINLARELSKQRLHYILREAARYEHIGPLISERYSDEKEPSTELAKLLSYISCKNTDSGIELRRNPLLGWMLQDLWSALQETVTVLLEEARTKASADNGGTMEALGAVFKEHLASALMISVITNEGAQHFRETHWRIWVSLLHSSAQTARRARQRKKCSCLACAYHGLQEGARMRREMQAALTENRG